MNATESLSLSDLQVVQRVVGGEKPMFELLMRRTNGILYKIARSYGFNHQDAEDLMQETHIAAYINLSKFEGRAQYRTWLVRIMLNNCASKFERAQYKMGNHFFATADENATPMFQNGNYNPEKNALNNELGNFLEKAIEQIPTAYRMVFVLREKEGLSVAETAEALNITETNVKVRLKRARVMLREKLESFYNTAPLYEFNLIYCDKIVNAVMAKI